MEVWLIQHIGTGKFMPEIKKGYSYWQPCDNGNEKFPPRIFTKEKSAKGSLANYLQGEIYKKYNDPWEDGSVTLARRNSRNKADFQIVKAELKF